MKVFNVLDSGTPSLSVWNEDQIYNFNEKMKMIATEAANNLREAEESAAKVLLTR